MIRIDNGGRTLDRRLREGLAPVARAVNNARGRAARYVNQRASTLNRTGMPIVSVIIPVYDVEPYLDGCLRSVERQEYRNLDIIVINDGSSDSSLHIAETHASRDTRIRIVNQRNGGLGSARNVGVHQARGEFLTFVDSDDTIPPNAIGTMVASARKTGSQIVVGALERVANGKTYRPHWSAEIHHRPRFGTSVDEAPDVLRNFYTPGKLYRADFWHRCQFKFREGVLFEDQPLVTEALCSASSVDILADTSYYWYAREDGTSLSQEIYVASKVRARREAIRLTAAALEKDGRPTVREAWMRTLLNAHFPSYLRNSLRADNETYDEIVAMIRETATVADLARIKGITPHHRVLLFHALVGNRDEVTNFILSDGLDQRAQPLQTDGRVWRYVFDSSSVRSDLPLELARVDLSQLVPTATLRSLRWESESTLVLTGWAYLPPIPSTHKATELDIALVNRSTNQRVRASVRRLTDPAATLEAGYRYVGQDEAAFEATFDLSALGQGQLPNISGPTSTWTVDITLDLGDYRRTFRFRRRSGNSTATHMRSGQVASGAFLEPIWTDEDGLGLQLVQRPFSVAAIDRSSDGVHIVVARNYGSTEPVLMEMDPESASDRRYAELRALPGGNQWSAELYAGGVPEGTWRMRVVTSDGRKRYIHASSAWLAGTAANQGSIAISANSSNQVTARALPRQCVITSLLPGSAGELRISGRSPYLAQGELRLSLCRAGTEMTTVDTNVDELGNWDVEFPIQYTYWGFRAKSLPPGYYAVTAFGRVTGGEVQETLELELADPIIESMPQEAVGVYCTAKIYLNGKGEVNVQVLPPLPTDQRSRFAQYQGIDRYRDSAAPLDDSVYYECLHGESANDSQLAIFEWLRSHRPDIKHYWGIKDHSMVVPDGAEAVIINSPKYFERLARSRYVCVNHELPKWFSRKNGQIVTQTYHGHPFKTMGVPRWRAQGVSEFEIQKNLAARSNWSILVAQNDDAKRLYEEAFPVNVEIAEIGSPRNDILVRRHDRLRRDLRERWGITESHVVILYAPTWRDYSAINPWISKPVDFINPVELREQLGDQYVVLVRGHSSHFRYVASKNPLVDETMKDGVLDVSGYPDVNPLIAASDVGVFDYSSIRFDYATTGKPMIFMVPDEQEYFAQLPPMLPYADTVVGPRVRTTSGLIREIEALGQYGDRFGGAYERFRRRFLPLEDGNAAERLATLILSPELAAGEHLDAG